jgi:hypothetical protein
MVHNLTRLAHKAEGRNKLSPMLEHPVKDLARSMFPDCRIESGLGGEAEGAGIRGPAATGSGGIR